MVNDGVISHQSFMLCNPAYIIHERYDNFWTLLYHNSNKFHLFAKGCCKTLVESWCKGGFPYREYCFRFVYICQWFVELSLLLSYIFCCRVIWRLSFRCIILSKGNDASVEIYLIPSVQKVMACVPSRDQQ